MRIVTGCLRPTPTGLAPASLRREKSTHRLAQPAVLDESHALSQLVSEAQPGKRQRLKSRLLFPRHAASHIAYIASWTPREAIGIKLQNLTGSRSNSTPNLYPVQHCPEKNG